MATAFPMYWADMKSLSGKGESSGAEGLMGKGGNAGRIILLPRGSPRTEVENNFATLLQALRIVFS